jgi:hypothetical protein
MAINECLHGQYANALDMINLEKSSEPIFDILLYNIAQNMTSKRLLFFYRDFIVLVCGNNFDAH